MAFVVKITTKKLSKTNCRNIAEEYCGRHVFKKEPKNMDSPGTIQVLFANSVYAQDFVKTIEQIELS